MKPLILAGLLFLAFALALAFSAWPQEAAQALPEYSAQTGEPCATCHVSPSGGGPRAPRGQGWLAAGKPGAVPDLLAALGLLGVNLQVDPADFVAPPGAASPAQPLSVQPGQAEALHRRLLDYPGN